MNQDPQGDLTNNKNCETRPVKIRRPYLLASILANLSAREYAKNGICSFLQTLES